MYQRKAVFIDMNNKIKKLIVVLISALLLIFITLAFCYGHYSKAKKEQAIAEQRVIEAQVKEKTINNAKACGYSIEFTEENAFCMEKEDIEYCFQIDPAGVIFDYCEFPVEEENVNVKKGNVVICIMNEGNDKLNVSYSDSRIILLDDGTEEPMFSASYFISNADFDKESLVIQPQIIDDKQKSIDAYDKIMRFITVDELKEQYNKALAICKQLNE